MKISLIVAIAENNGIGKDNDLLWRLPKDMQYFKSKTISHHIITGRKNYISIPEKFRPLVDRTNIVLTHQSDFNEVGCIIKHSIEDAIKYAESKNETELFIIGGGQIYNEVLNKDLVDKMYITHIHQPFEADTFFPEIDNSIWKKTNEEHHNKDEKNSLNFTFTEYEKK